MTEMTPERLAEHHGQRDYTREHGIDYGPDSHALMSALHAEAMDEIDRQAAEIKRLQSEKWAAEAYGRAADKETMQLRDDIERLRAALTRMFDVEEPGYFITSCHEENDCHDAINAHDLSKHALVCPVRIAYDALNPEPTT